MSTYQEISDTYNFLGKIGEGGGGVVYLAWHKRLGKHVVFKEIKFPSIHLQINRKEADILKNLHHEALPGILDFILMDGRYYTVMDYISGQSLEQYIRTGKNLSQERLCEWSVVLLRALEVLHAQNPPVIHCDIKPSNIMISEEGRVFLIDFNVSYFFGQHGTLGRSPGFSAPELDKAIRRYQENDPCYMESVTPKIDLYGLGSTLFYVITGKKLNPIQPDWDALYARVSESFANVIKTSLQQDPEKRFADAKAMRKAIEQTEFSDQQIHAQNKRHHRSIVILTLCLALAATLGGAGLYAGRKDENNAYHAAVEKQSEALKSGAYALAANELYENAVALRQDDLQTYYQKALALYKQGNFQETAVFVTNNICSQDAFAKQDNFENALYLLADSLFRQGLYERSVKVYEDLMKKENLVPTYWRDYAIAMGYAGQIDQAGRILEKGAELGIDDENIQFVQAELLYLQDMTEQACQILDQLTTSNDSDIQSHAYERLGSWLLETEQTQKALSVLKQAQMEIETGSQPVILELLAQAQIALGNEQNNDEYRLQALDTLKLIEENGWQSDATYNTRAILYQKLGQLDEASDTVKDMEERYGISWNSLKRKASLALERESTKLNQDRDYREFRSAYQEANDLYDPNQDDPEMRLLSEQYEQLRQGGWLD